MTERSLFTPQGFYNTAQGNPPKAGPPWVSLNATSPTLKGLDNQHHIRLILCNPFRVEFSASVCPRVGLSGNPGLDCETPSGLRANVSESRNFNQSGTPLLSLLRSPKFPNINIFTRSSPIFTSDSVDLKVKIAKDSGQWLVASGQWLVVSG